MKKSVAAVLFLLASAAVPVVGAPAAHADVCGSVGGRHVSAGGCTDVGRDVAVGAAVAAAPEDAAAQAAAGLPPCYTPAGVPYYTPGDLPCN